MGRKKEIFFTVICIFLFSASLAFSLTSITNVRFWTAPDKTRVVFDLSSPIEFNLTKKGPTKQITLNLKNIVSRLDKTKLVVDNGLIKSIEMETFNKERGVKVTLRLERETEFDVFYVKAQRYSEDLFRPDRLVVDVFVPERKAIEEALIKQVEDLRQKDVKIIVIDPGHGGEDPGAIGRRYRLKEKVVTLDIAKYLKKLIDSQPGLRAILTRDGDYFVPLRKRTEIARKLRADLFVSIHCNSNRKRWKNGTSVYVVSYSGASDEASRILASWENASDLIFDVDPQSDNILTRILVDLTQTQAINESLILGKLVMDRFNVHLRRRYLGVKRAGFTVLKSINIPSILVEVAFISNPREERLLRSPEFRQKAANAIFEGIGQYFGMSFAPPVEIASRETKTEIKSPKFSFHRVKKGETLWRIANLYNTTVSKLRSLNKLGSNRISVGQKLIIPRR
jgi:N-acetylmuramoyl-L-alanine amidase